MNQERNDEIEIDLVELIYVLLGKIWVIVLATALGLGLSAAYTMTMMKPVYTSTSWLFVLPKATSITSLTDLQMGTSLTQDYMVFVTSRPVTDQVISELELDMSSGELVKHITVENPTNSRFLKITVSYYDPYMAKSIVDKLSDIASEKMGEIMETQGPNILDYGHIAESPSSPNLMKNALLGAIIGFVLSAGAIIVLHLMNDAICTTEDVERYLEINVLGLIPLEEGVSKKKTRGKDKDAAVARKKSKKSKGKKVRA